MADADHKQYPPIKGLTWHRHQHYSFFTPIDWWRFEWPDDREGEIYGPDPDDPHTVFSVVVDDLGVTVTPDDLDVLAKGFFEALEALPEVQIEHRQQFAMPTLIELEAKYTYREEGETRRCWVRVLYHQTRQITLTAKGATPDRYDYWLPLFFESMMTANVHSVRPEVDSLI